MTTVSSPPSPPRALWYVAALVVFLAGMAAMGGFLVNRLSNFDAGLTQIVVPGEKQLALEAGSYTVFHEAQSVVDGRIYNSPGLGGLEVTVTASSGTPLTLTPSSTGGRYSFGSRSGFAAFDFTVASPGDYIVRGSYAGGAPGPETVIAVGKGFGAMLFGTIAGALGLAFGGAVIAALIAVTVLVRRRRAGFRF